MTSVGTLSGEEVLGVFLVLVRVSEVDFHKGAASSGVVEDGSHYSSDVPLSLGEVEVTIPRWCDSLALGGSIYTALFTLSLA